MAFIAKQRDVKLVFSAVSAKEQALFEQWELTPQHSNIALVAENLDSALEWSENRILDDYLAPISSRQTIETFQSIFGKVADDFEKRTIKAGDILIEKGAASHDVYFLTKGRVSVWITTPDGKRIRVRSFAKGAFVGEIATLTKQVRTADIIADENSVVYCIDQDSIKKLEEEEPEIVLNFYRILARNLAESVRRNNMMIGQMGL